MRKLDKEEYKPFYILPIYKVIYFLNREWSYIAVLEVLYKELDLCLEKNNTGRLSGINNKITKLALKESRLFKVFEEFAGPGNMNIIMQTSDTDDEEDEHKLTNVTAVLVDNIRMYHQMIASDDGIIEEKMLSIESGQDPEEAIEKYKKLVEFSEKQYKKHGGVLYTNNYAIRLRNVAERYFDMKHYEDTIDWYIKASVVYQTMLKHERHRDYADLAMCYEEAGRAALWLETESYNELAEEMFGIVRDIREDIRNKFPDVSMGDDLAIAYFNLAISQDLLKEYDMSFINFKAAYDIYFIRRRAI
jgi:tetratricopeptide (TPR) repeat protein